MAESELGVSLDPDQGLSFSLYHSQDCCKAVTRKSVNYNNKTVVIC
jgi:hypothetical protein